MALGDRIGGFIETLGSIYIARETIANGGTPGAGNTGSDYQNPATGENHDGSTLVSGRLVAGVSNAALLGGIAVLLGLGVMAWVVIKD